MLNQSFSYEIIKHLIKKEDVRRFQLWDSTTDRQEIDDQINSIVTTINNSSFDFGHILLNS